MRILVTMGPKLWAGSRVRSAANDELFVRSIALRLPHSGSLLSSHDGIPYWGSVNKVSRLWLGTCAGVWS